jgi:hypothetical protein
MAEQSQNVSAIENGSFVSAEGGTMRAIILDSKGPL